MIKKHLIIEAAFKRLDPIQIGLKREASWVDRNSDVLDVFL